MFSRISAIALLALPLLAAATAVPRGGDGQCNTGAVQCCNQVGTAHTLLANDAGLASVLNLVVAPVTAILGVSCTPISVIAAAGNSCTSQPVCCTQNNFNGAVNVGCSPVNANL
ncbi:hypothetical protein CVT25_010265 [Psilocybe cyanescens]|uniref:Hydrophobin n=1 Tax=Psilocybe cyanescens TaxID=93625 RepID=A0A409XCZ9_PSICY|nr:hypothetical protein CVT25_010265 [Psilocybe cyanescens]